MKTNINPMNQAKRCHARSKRTLRPCQAPAVTGWNVCRFHGAGGGAPTGKANGNYKHGGRTKEAIAEQAYFRELIREVRQVDTLLGSV